MRILLQTSAALIALCAVFFPAAIVVEHLLHRTPVPWPSVTRTAVTGVIASLVLISFIWVPIVVRLWLAARGAGQPLVSVYGHCYATLLSPSGYFARIGLSEETARWYVLPLSWDATVMLGSDQFELLVNPVTGYVDRLRRLGGAPVELRQDTQDAEAEGDAAEADEADEGEATSEQRRQLYRTARQERLRWAINPAEVLWNAWAFIVGGIFFAPGMLIFDAYLLLSPSVRFAPGGKEATIISLAAFTLVGLALIGTGVYLFRIWRRLKRLSRQLPPTTVEGAVLVWTRYMSLFTSGKGALVELQLVDGTRKLFLVPGRWEHRISHRGNRVAVTFVPGTGRVLDVKAFAYGRDAQDAQDAQG
jgi:hypothetical protein